MRYHGLVSFALVLAWLPPPAAAQVRQTDEEFAKAKPAVGDPLPELTVYDPDGKEVKTASLRDHYTILTFGCLT
jgi:cytochrome oxidase Cu insertion factor (SCO1/SenC/PrrC family)